MIKVKKKNGDIIQRYNDYQTLKKEFETRYAYRWRDNGIWKTGQNILHQIIWLEQEGWINDVELIEDLSI